MPNPWIYWGLIILPLAIANGLVLVLGVWRAHGRLRAMEDVPPLRYTKPW